MKKRMAVFLAVLVMILCGCRSEKESVSTQTPTTTAQTEAVQLAETVAEPAVPETTEAEPVDQTIWLPPYWTDKGKLEFHCLVKNESMGSLSVESMQTVYYLNGEPVQEREYDKNAIKAFLWRPFNKLDLSLAASTLLIVDDYPSEDGFDHTLVTVTTLDEQGTETVLTYNFTMDEAEVTPSTLTDDWELSTSWLVEEFDGWNWTCQPVNNTDDVLTLELVHHVNYNDGIPVGTDSRTPEQFSDFIQTVKELAPGVIMPYTEGITQMHRNFNQRETTYVYRDSNGQQYLQTFYFRYEDALQGQEATRFYLMMNHGYLGDMPEGLTMLTAEETVAVFGGLQYSEKEIQKMIDEKLSLDEVTKKLTTLGDVFRYMNLKGFYSTNTPMHGFWYNDHQWNAMNSAHHVFKANYGCCSDGSALVNYFLQGDYDEQGYIQEVNSLDRHVFNWFRIGETYYFVDWTEIVGKPEDFWGVFATDNPQIFTNYDVRRSQEISTVYEIYLQYLYPREGTPLPIGIQRKSKPYIRTLPSQIEDSVMLLYEDPEICVLEFQEGPLEEDWPDAAQNS